MRPIFFLLLLLFFLYLFFDYFSMRRCCVLCEARVYCFYRVYFSVFIYKILYTILKVAKVLSFIKITARTIFIFSSFSCLFVSSSLSNDRVRFSVVCQLFDGSFFYILLLFFFVYLITTYNRFSSLRFLIYVSYFRLSQFKCKRILSALRLFFFRFL